jgi:ferritin-like metal-binding protein YciE
MICLFKIKDLLSAEKQILKALPKMIKAASNDDLREALEAHLEETEEQTTRLEQICEEFEIPLRAPKCKGMEGLIEEGQSALEDAQDDSVRDAAIICAAQRIEHYEMAAYGCARTFAEQLGYDNAAELLQQTLDEEKAADEKLTQIATSEVNAEASA